MSNSKQPSRETVRFYESEKVLLKYAGDYALTYKFRENLSDPATNWKPGLKETFTRYYAEDWDKLDDRCEYKKQRCLRQIESINKWCRYAHVASISEPERLVDRLLSTDRRQFWKKTIDRLEKNDVIVSPQDIEQAYRRGEDVQI